MAGTSQAELSLATGPFHSDARSVSGRKRDEIQRAALALFSRDGYERTSVDAIAAEAGVSKRTVYNHFGDKENLFLAVVQRTFAWMIGLAHLPTTPGGTTTRTKWASSFTATIHSGCQNRC